MEQRSLRLGDIVDDYCPRERRITNHAIVAIVEDAIRQTRCTTCDHEHVFKQGREPRRRRKEVETLYEQVLADVTGGQLVPPRAPSDGSVADGEDVPAAQPASAAADADGPEPGEDGPVPEGGWLTHRQLIRATLPKQDGELPPPRPIPEFTMYQRPPARSARFRFGGGGGGSFGQGGQGQGSNGNVAGPSRDGRSGRQFQGNGQGAGARDAGGGAGRSGRRRSNNKRSR